MNNCQKYGIEIFNVMERVIVFFIASLIILLLCTSLYFYNSDTKKDLKIENLENKVILDSINYFECDKIKNDYAKLNLTLRNVVQKSSALEKELINDTAYVNLAAKYN